MDFTYTDEQRQLRDTLSRYLAKEYDFARRREMLRSPATRTHWKAFADLGVLALTIPEGDGGLGAMRSTRWSSRKRLAGRSSSSRMSAPWLSPAGSSLTPAMPRSVLRCWRRSPAAR
jgi:alkylation response protein AidB-like acyl-CoA dehydrogenase